MDGREALIMHFIEAIFSLIMHFIHIPQKNKSVQQDQALIDVALFFFVDKPLLDSEIRIRIMLFTFK